MALPKFMIADDPVTDPDNEYIFHTQEPRFIAKRVEDDDENAHIDIVEEIDDVAGFFNNDPVQLQVLLDELGEWYSDYMDWLEEDELDEEG
ncbi:hypothetical protein [Paraflavitalea sp. CAU 1676]|uniref:hypothetical protein n=1 Tax=Paraflavitalea sp. CAU 1676 TaxID=3032598 RepID=UPI0023DA1749|nr:hypothetical protein [Paraflavitalea sp. CAU 1676]MDF2188106.1 hypothetical protein [Paraflavitalea sp. CAU 1676]